MASNTDLVKVQAQYDKFLRLKAHKDQLVRERDEHLVQQRVATEQLQALYPGQDWQAGFEADQVKVQQMETQLASLA